MSHNTLANYYTNCFNFTFLHSFCSITELENMFPFEMNIYENMIEQKDEEKRESAIQQASIDEALRNRRF